MVKQYNNTLDISVLILEAQFTIHKLSTLIIYGVIYNLPFFDDILK